MNKSILAALFLSCSLAIGADSSPPSAPLPPATDDLSQYKTADALWTHIQTQSQSLSTDINGGNLQGIKTLIPQIQASANAFVKQYPNDTHVWDAKMIVAGTGILAMRIHLAGAPTLEQISGQFAAVADDKAAPQKLRAEANLSEISLAIQGAVENSGDAAKWDAADAKIADFEKEFGSGFSLDGAHPIIAVIRSQEMQILKGSGNTARYQALVQKLASDPQPEIAAMAQQELAAQKQLVDLKAKPVDLKFTAVDGAAIDLAKMRGKVILIDFWATWCPPCREEVPDVVAAYKKYHDQGFEVVGISLDQNKDSLLAFTKQNGMTWPQYFDGKGWDNAISKSFGIDAIPAMWLVDKKGMVVTTDGRDNLAGQIEQLLK
ncbi:MAG TPA: TlpA disulfide reductase family protein [Candidatus Methylacidiphilales bacterium]|nr:TlpA disulfide reductase family protein [Candidatus Methylacidiphilales bacterium]